MKRPHVPRLTRLALAATLACGATAASTPALAVITPGDIVAVFDGAKKAYDAVAFLRGLFDPQPGIADVLNRMVAEIRHQRNLEIKSSVQALVGRYRELHENPNNYDESRWANFMDDSYDDFAAIRGIILPANDAESAYDLSPTLNVLVPLRALAMNNQNALATARGLPLPHLDHLIDFWIDDGNSVSYQVIGVPMLRCEGPSGTAFPSTWAMASSAAHQKQLYKHKFANYWFVGGVTTVCSGPRGCSSVAVYCNVAQWRCDRPLPRQNDVLFAENSRITQRMVEDPVIQVIRANLRAAMTVGHDDVQEPICGAGFGDGVGTIRVLE